MLPLELILCTKNIEMELRAARSSYYRTRYKDILDAVPLVIFRGI